MNVVTSVFEQEHQSQAHPNTEPEPISNKSAASTQTSQGSKGSSDGESAAPTQKSQAHKGTDERSKQKESKQAMPEWKQAESSLFAQIDGNSEQQTYFESAPSEYENTRATLLRRRAILFMNSVRTICPNSGINIYYARFSGSVKQTYIRQIKDRDTWKDTTDDKIGTLDRYTYTDAAGMPISSTATAGNGYKFVGWYDLAGNKVADDMLLLKPEVEILIHGWH